MGRVRGRGKKQTTSSGEEEKILTQRRRGRPQKPAKDDTVLVGEDHKDKAAENGDVAEDTSKDVKTDDAVMDTIRKRKWSAKDGDMEENVIKQHKSEMKDAARTVGFRTNGNRRKNRPRRAAEAGVECQ